jgi:hypothetical protein
MGQTLISHLNSWTSITAGGMTFLCIVFSFEKRKKGEVLIQEEKTQENSGE